MAIKDLSKVKQHVLFCNGGTCKKGGAEEITLAIRTAIHAHGLQDEVHTTKTFCNGRCEDGPIAILMPSCTWVSHLTLDEAEAFVTRILEAGCVPESQQLFRLGLQT